MAEQQTQRHGGRQQALTRRDDQQQLSAQAPAARRGLHGSPVSTMRRVLDELDTGLFSWGPASVMRRMLDDLERMFEADFFEGADRGARAYAWVPPVDIRRCDDRLVISVDLPGMSQDQLEISIEGNAIVIEGERVMQGDGASAVRSERVYGRFRRIVVLPEGVDPERVSARLESGVLEITVPLPASQATCRINVETGDRPQAMTTQARTSQAEQWTWTSASRS